jgi:hypothetical protein
LIPDFILDVLETLRFIGDEGFGFVVGDSGVFEGGE